ncbi:hypothetical protein ACIPVB_12690 [Microbacterium sp. NPDC090007]|uniref:hypothetical protein n=1 Tax=Microbacterium sp. NPDC090007 TaxID=3364204 RepID=UPI0037FCC89F
MRTHTRMTTTAVLLAAAICLLPGCVSFGPSGQERADQLAAQLESQDLGISEVTADYTASISSTMIVRITLDPSIAESRSVSQDALRPILTTIGRGTDEMRLGSMDLYARDPEGQDVSLAAAASELGLTDAVHGTSLTLLQSDLRAIRGW